MNAVDSLGLGSITSDKLQMIQEIPLARKAFGEPRVLKAMEDLSMHRKLDFGIAQVERLSQSIQSKLDVVGKMENISKLGAPPFPHHLLPGPLSAHSIIAESMRRMDISSIANILASANAFASFQNLDDSLAKMCSFYADMGKYLESQRAILPPSFILSGKPEREICLATIGLRSLDRKFQFSDDENELLAEVEESKEDIYSKLKVRYPHLVDVRKGALIAIEGKNPDKSRHVAASLRACFDKVLLSLVPDKEFQAWQREKRNELDDMGEREKMIRYICRKFGSGSFARFIGADIEAVIKLWQLLCKLDHSSKTRLTEAQLRVIATRTDAAILMLIEAVSE